MTWVPFRNTKNWIAKQVEDCKSLPDVNSRLMFAATSIGIIALAGDREAIFMDYEKIRAMEARLVFTP